MPRSRPALALAVQYAGSRRGLPAAATVRRWAAAALERSAAVTVRFVGLREGRSLNALFRGKDYATNVLTFVYESAPRRPLSGDIVLCAPVLAKEAREQGKAIEAHYAHLTVHGLLHLQGWEHDTAGDARAMEERETRLLARLGFPDPYAVTGPR